MNSSFRGEPSDPEGHRHSNSPPLVDGGMLGLIRLLVANRGLLWQYPLAVGVLVVPVSFLFRNVYRSGVTILPPERDFQSISQPAGDLRTFFSGGMALPVMATPSDVLAAVLESRSVKESTVVRLALDRRWGVTHDDAVDKLRDEVGVKVAPSGIISFWVESDNRWFCDTLANSMVSIADRLNQAIVNVKASRTRQFVEERLRDTQIQLDSAAAALERFQQEHRTVALEAEVQAIIEGAAALRAQQTADEIELSILGESLSPDHPRIRSLSTRISQTQQRLAAMEFPLSADSARVYLGAGLSELPRLAQELAQRLRDVKVADALYELLTQQYEHARIQERRDTPTFSVLDPASGGGEKVRPKRLYLGVATLLVGFILVAGLVVIRSWLDRLAVADPARHESIIAVWHAMFSRKSSRSRELTR